MNISIRKDSSLLVKMLDVDDNYMVMSIKNNNTSIIVVNIYKHNNKELLKASLENK